MSTEHGTALVEAYFEAMNSRDFDRLEEIIHPAYIDHVSGQTGRDALKQYLGGMAQAFPDFLLTAASMVAQGDLVAVRNSIEGTHKGTFRELRPTGKRISVDAFQLYRINGGQLAEHWELADMETLMLQLGDGPRTEKEAQQSWSTFKPETAALLLIDHQIGTMQLIKTLDPEDVRRRTLALAKAASILGMPVVLTSSQEERIQGPLIDGLAEILPEAFAQRVRRPGIVNAWDDPAFRKAVEATGRRQLIMGGVTTDVCLIYPTISAVEAGYEVQAVLDISGSPFETSEFAARQRMESAGVQFTTSNTVIAELAQNWSTNVGRPLIELLFSDILPPIQARQGQ